MLSSSQHCTSGEPAAVLPAPTRADCVVDARDDAVIVWHVNTSPAPGLSRLTGAWTLDINEGCKIRLLVAERRVLSTSSGKEALGRLGITVPVLISAAATRARLLSERDELQTAYEAQGRKDLVAPTWPLLPAPIDMQNPPSAKSPEPTQVALALARWLAQVATVWEQIEAQRVVRAYMPGGRERRPTPIVTSEVG